MRVSLGNWQGEMLHVCDAKTGGEGNLDVRCVRPAIDTISGVMFVPDSYEINPRVGISGKLCAVMRDIIRLVVVRDVVASGCDERVCKRVE